MGQLLIDVCDVCDARGDQVAVTTVAWPFGKKPQEMELCEVCKAAYDADLARWGQYAHKAGDAKPVHAKTEPADHPAPGEHNTPPDADYALQQLYREMRQDIRAEMNMTEKRGRLPEAIVDAYRHHHGIEPGTLFATWHERLRDTAASNDGERRLAAV